ncbi:MAG: helix-turn-helix domain-containing protein [Anaerolineaceae bacterium]
MLNTFFVRDLETMKALSDPRRVEILGLLQKPRTTRQVADVLGETANAMYYHILELEKYRLIKVVKTAMKGHMQEKYYQAVAHFYAPAVSLFEGRFDPYKTDNVQVLQEMQETALNEMQKAVVDPELEEQLPQSSFLAQKRLFLTQQQQREFRKKLSALIREYEDGQADGAAEVLLTAFLFPVSQTEETQTA